MPPDRAEGALISALRLTAHVAPVLFSHVFVDVDEARIQRVLAVLPWAGDPVLLAGPLVELIEPLLRLLA